MEIALSPAARQETQTAAEYYEEKVQGLGKAFIESLRSSLNHVRNYPYASVLIKPNYRRHLLNRFPFGIIYRIDSEIIYIVAIMHLKRKPDYWRSR